jgi:hypothetical protein
MSLLKHVMNKNRKITEVDSWDGSASNYSTPEAYAKASLLNFNTGDPDTWTKDLIKLPVRNEGDPGDTYIKQAVQASAGGRGITQVTKPDGVEQSVFDSKLKTAANKIISAYNQWEGTAPDSVYRVADKEAPKDRAIAFDDVYNMVLNALYLADEAENTYTRFYDIYMEEDTERFFALVSREGVVYKVEILPVQGSLGIGEFIPVTETAKTSSNAIKEEKRSKSKVKVYRGLQGEMRWLAIASVAVLNRVGEIDSRALFDSFIEHANRTQEFPVLNVYHLGDNSEIGIADMIAREEYVYIATGTFHDNEFGRAFYEGLKDRDDWGNSIEFDAYPPMIETVNLEGTVVQVPIYYRGINTGITILREKDAASLFTLHKSKGGNK